MKRLGLFVSILLGVIGIVYLLFFHLPDRIKEDGVRPAPARSNTAGSGTDSASEASGGQRPDIDLSGEEDAFGRLDTGTTIAGYTIRVYVDDAARTTTLRILQGAEGLITVSEPFPGNVLLLTEEPLDLTGDTIPEIIVARFSGGAHCCWVYSIYSLGATPKRLATIEAGSGTIGTEDIDLDGQYEIGMTDTTFAYWEAPYSDSPAVEVVLEWNGRGFDVAPRFMKKAPPGFAEIQEELTAVRARFDDYDYDMQDERWRPVPPALWGYMLELIYTGNGDMAFSFFEDAWPDDKPGREPFLDAFRAQLAQSPFYSRIKDLNGWN